METAVHEGPKTPAVIIITAILNFFSALISFMFVAIGFAALVFGSMASVYSSVNQQLAAQNIPMTLGMQAFFIFMLAVGVSFFALFLSTGIGLLKGKRFAWFLQVAFSIVFLFGFPFWTVVNAVILVLFFQPSVRNYFKV